MGTTQRLWANGLNVSGRRITLYLFVIFADLLAAQPPLFPLQNGIANQPRASLFPPVLQVKSFEGFLPESAEIGTTVRISPSLHADSLQILVADKDLRPGMPPAIYQYVLTGYGAEKFAVDQRGYLYLNAGPLDADNNSSTFQLHVQAKEVDTEPVRSSEPITIRIHVIDVNDNSPAFELPVYVLAVAANGAAERVVARLAATDLDSGKFSRLHYKIVDVSDGARNSFRYDDQTNELKAVGALKPGHRYQVVIEAEDGGGRSGRTVALVFASPDGSVAPDEQPSSGSMESSQTPLLPIVPFTPATTRKAPSTAKTEPVQTMVTELSEATPPNSIVAILGDDGTKSKVYFKIVDGNADGKFSLEETSGTLTTRQSFDREKTDMYTLQIEARSRQPDQALYWTVLQISITDANDNVPEFLDAQPIGLRLRIGSSSEIKPNMKIGTVYVRDLDSDDNGRVSLQILSPQNRLFAIKDNGDLSVNGDFTEEHFGEHVLSVVASDHGDPPLEARTNVIVTVDGSALVKSTGPSSENAERTVEEDLDISAGPASFSRATLPTTIKVPVPFTRVAPEQRVSSESNLSPSVEELSLELPMSTVASPHQAGKSGGSKASSLLPKIPHTQAPRLAPVFLTPVLSVMVEENDDNLELATLEARYTDGQAGPITYVMQKGDPSLFSVGSHTGKLVLLKALDAEMDREFSVVVGTAEAASLTTDDKLPHTSTITIKVIDVNDWIPNFETNNYLFVANDKTEPGTVLGQVTAFDQDRDEPNNRIRYRLLNSGGNENYFNVNAENGLITLSKDISEFVDQRITLRIEAADGGEPAQATQTEVTVSVERTESELIPRTDTSLSSHPKEGAIQFSMRNYTASVSEGARPPQVALVLNVVNKPYDTRFVMCSIVSGNYRGAFSVSPGVDGNCELRTQVQLDRETVERYLLNVTVSSDDDVDFALVSITVLDVNDNSPRFAYPGGAGSTNYFAGISRKAGSLTRATDADLGNSSLVQYELDSLAADSVYFSIDRYSGEITTKQSVEHMVQRSRRGHFELRVTACDSPPTGQPLCSKADVTVNVINDQQRFITTLRKAQPHQIRAHEQDVAKALQQFTGLCTTVVMEKLEERAPSATGEPSANLYWYAVNPISKKICRKQEFRKLFEPAALELVAGKLRPWFSLDAIEQDVEEDSTEKAEPGILSLNFKSMSTLTVALIVAGTVAAMVVVCALCLIYLCSARYKAKHSAMHSYPHIYPMPKYGNAIYLPNSATLERDKIYETQMLELPISDEDFTLKNSARSAMASRGTHYNGRLPSSDKFPFQHASGKAHGHTGHAYGSGHYGGGHDLGDFSVEENMYAVNTPSRLDAGGKYVY